MKLTDPPGVAALLAESDHPAWLAVVVRLLLTRNPSPSTTEAES